MYRFEDSAERPRAVAFTSNCGIPVLLLPLRTTQSLIGGWTTCSVVDLDPEAAGSNPEAGLAEAVADPAGLRLDVIARPVDSSCLV